MVFNPSLELSYQVNKDLKNFESGQVVTYYVYKVIKEGLLYMYSADTFAEAKSWVLADQNRAMYD